MATKEKLRLRKELERLHGMAKRWNRQDLTAGRWLGPFLEQVLASHSGGRTPPELKQAFPDAETSEDRADEVTTRTIHAAIAVTDAYVENLSGTEVRYMKDKKLGGPPQKLTGDTVALVAELLYVVKLYLDQMFDIAACHGKVFSGGDMDRVADILGQSLGNFDPEDGDGKVIERVGAKIFERGVAQTIGERTSDALRKGFYCYMGKSVGNTMRDVVPDLDDWQEPAAETGPMLAGEPEDFGFST